MTGRLAVAGALVCGALALVLTLVFDPAEGTGPTSYEGGARFGEIFRYVLLGAAGGACLARLRAGARGGLLWGVGVLAAAALVVGPAIDTVSDGKPEERREEKFRQGFIAGCSDGMRAQGYPEAVIEPYCGCLHDEVAGDSRMEEAEATLRSGGQAPAWLVAVTERCAAKVAPPS
jgi:hypothetical protein